MTTPTPLTSGRKSDTGRRRQKIIKAIADASRDGDDLSVSAIARRAGIDRSTLYRCRDLLEQLHLAQANGPTTGNPATTVSRESLRADLANAAERNRRLYARNQHLERALSERLGEEAWRESGLGAPTDIESLQHTITALEQETVALRGELAERDQDLAAARSVNHSLITQLNAADR